MINGLLSPRPDGYERARGRIRLVCRGLRFIAMFLRLSQEQGPQTGAMPLHYEFSSTTEALSDEDMRQAVRGVLEKLGPRWVTFTGVLILAQLCMCCLKKIRGVLLQFGRQPMIAGP
jgi:hypothetical protein